MSNMRRHTKNSARGATINKPQPPAIQSFVTKVSGRVKKQKQLLLAMQEQSRLDDDRRAQEGSGWSDEDEDDGAFETNLKEVVEMLSLEGVEHRVNLAPTLQRLELEDFNAFNKMLKSNGPEHWIDIMLGHLKVIKYFPNYLDLAFQFQNEMALSFYSKTLPAEDGNWCLSVMRVVTRDLYRVAAMADRFDLERNGNASHRIVPSFEDDYDSNFQAFPYERNGVPTGLKSAVNSGSRLNQAAATISRAIRACMADKTDKLDQSKVWGIYTIVNCLFKIYFKLKTLNLCKPILRTISNATIPELRLFKMGDQVMFRYYSGILSFRNDFYHEAAQHLTYALGHTYFCESEPKFVRNKLLILVYLIPAKMTIGTMPTEKMFVKYPDIADLYKDIVDAVQVGDLAGFDQACFKQQDRLVRLGTWLAIERVRPIVIRRVFHKVWLIMDKPNRIPLSSFQVAFGLSANQELVERAEIECILANLIYKRLIRGYISHEKQMLVLPKTNAFPCFADD